MLKEEALLYPPFILILTTKKGDQYAIDCNKKDAIVEAFNNSTNSLIWLSDYDVWISRFDFDSLDKYKVWDNEVVILKQLQKRIQLLSENKNSSLSFTDFLSWVNSQKASLN